MSEHDVANVLVRRPRAPVHPNRTMLRGRLDATLASDTQGLDRCTRAVVATKGADVADLVAIGYPDESTAIAAEEEAQRLADDLVLQPDAIAAIVRTKDGKFKVTTNHHIVGTGATYGMLWGLLFGVLFFVPVFGMAVGAGLGALMGKLEKAGIDKDFQKQVRDLLQPGTSALFLVVEKGPPDKAVEALSKYGGTVLKSSLSPEAEQQLQQELHGSVKQPVNA
jgi:uncharacterized membrane protein